VIAGLPPSSLSHGVIPGLVLRLYLLEFRGGVLAIEIDDIMSNKGRNMVSLDSVVKSMTFDSR
jgi:hypothetical protein